MRLQEILERLQEKGLSACSEDITEFIGPSKDIDLEVDWGKVKRASRLLSLLANPLRLAILSLLSRTELPVCIIAEALGADQSLVSHHLNKLRNEGVIEVKVVGRFRIYKIREDLLDEIKALLKDILNKPET
jgi:DNA-binding transcriptional ArsR family regulator